MRRLTVFNQVTLDGFIADLKGDMSWAHKSDPEWDEFVASNAGGGGHLLFGRVTYDMMVSYWPTPRALKNNRAVAEGMNSVPKTVFSRTLGKANWNNTTIVKGDIVAAVRKMKSEPGKDMVILGSASIVSQLAPHGVINEYQLIVNPIVLGKGKSMFDSLKQPLPLKETSTRTFGNGNVLLCYEPRA